MRKLRLAAGMTQTALAAEVGVSRQTIISIEQRPVDASLSLAACGKRRACSSVCY